MVWTLVAVALTGVIVIASLLTPPSSIVLERKKLAQISEPLVESADRSPASIETEFSATAIDEKGQQALDFKLPCEGSTKFSKSVVQVRLSGSLCETKKTTKVAKAAKREIASTEIRNEANGFSATVFYPGKNQFTTDYMSLAPGANRIRILHVFKQGGKEEREFLIER